MFLVLAARLAVAVSVSVGYPVRYYRVTVLLPGPCLRQLRLYTRAR